MKKYRLYQVDSFTREKFSGNPAGVVLNADGLNDIEMQKIARELNNSETAFVFQGDGESYDVHTRYFSPSCEVPICGHATIAAMYVLAKERKMKKGIILNKTGVGILPVDIDKADDEYKITMTQGQVEFGEILTGENKKNLMDALKIQEGNLIGNLDVQIVSTGHSKVIVALNDRSVLNSIEPDFLKLKHLSKVINCNGYFLFALGHKKDDYAVYGRMFAPAIGINEDPVTGNGNGPLGAYIVKNKLMDCGYNELSYRALQGEAIGRSGEIFVHVDIENGEGIKVKVSGNAVIVFETEIII